MPRVVRPATTDVVVAAAAARPRRRDARLGRARAPPRRPETRRRLTVPASPLPPPPAARPAPPLDVQAIRPTVTVRDLQGAETGATVPLPAVFAAPIRRDVVHFVHTNVAKNHRQAYAVSYAAGEQTSAMSWGTGRAVARIPRVSGGGTGRSGSAAFGNMCRGGRLYAPTKIWRRWHRKVNVGQRRYAVASAVAATAVPALVMARGHKVDAVPEIPLVVRGLEGVAAARDAKAFLLAAGAYADVERVEASRKLRAGKGKGRSRRFVQRRGPLVVHAGATDAPGAAGAEDVTEARKTERAFRNIPGVELVHVDRLNLLKLAPGGHLGRFVVWSERAFTHLARLFGEGGGAAAELKKGFHLPRPMMANADLARLINSTEVQAVVRPAIAPRRLARQKKNPLVNAKAMIRLNPYAKVVREAEAKAAAERAAAKAAGAKGGKGKSAKAAAVPKAAKKAAAASTRNDKTRRRMSKAIIKAITSDEFKRPSEFLKA